MLGGAKESLHLIFQLTNLLLRKSSLISQNGCPLVSFPPQHCTVVVSLCICMILCARIVAGRRVVHKARSPQGPVQS